MKKFFAFRGTISGSSFILRALFSIVLSLPFLIIVISLFASVVMNYMDVDFANAEGMSMAESNAVGEKAGVKIAEEISQNGLQNWLSANVSTGFIVAIILSLIPVFWFTLATYYKRVSALFYSNRVKVFFAFIAVEVTLDIVGLSSGNDTIYWICSLIGLAIFGYLIFSNSPIGEHDG